MKILSLFLILFSTYTYGQVISRPLHNPPEVVNAYTEVLSFDVCSNTITVSADSAYKVGDTVLLIQMKGALIDTNNTASFGTILDYKNAGNYEFNYISGKSGNLLTFKNKLTKAYDIPEGVVQLVRVPYMIDPVFVDGLTCMKWDGTKGGVLAIISNHITCYDDIDIGGMGFRGGEGNNLFPPPGDCFADKYSYPFDSQFAAFKGESIAVVPPIISKGRGSPAAGGGGGLAHNSGGGGGANAGAGGYGGYQTDTCGNAPFDNRGIGGSNLLYNASAEKIFMGSGGGAGHADNIDFNGALLDGGSGGGIAIIIADSLTMDSHQILANGNDGKYCYSLDCNDGMGGGGAGGTVLLQVNRIIDTLTIQTPGGNGAHMRAPLLPGGKAGPGGGGGGGVLFMTNSALPANVGLINNEGFNGFLILNAANPWGATKGTAGLSFFNLVLPFDTDTFKPNIDSVKIKDSLITCNSFKFSGLGFTNTNPITNWYWDFSDGNTAITQNTAHEYASENTFLVKLVVTDTEGCKDSITDIVNPKIIFVDAGLDKFVCSNIPVSVILNGVGIGTFAWTPALYLNDSTQQNPIATVDTTTTFYLSLTKSNCTVSDSVKIIIYPAPVLSVTKSNDINCILPYTHLNASGALYYTWSQSLFLNYNNIANPVANPVMTTKFIVTGENNNGCKSKDSITVFVDLNKQGFELPNSFTPNGDGLNDCFGIKYYRDVQNLVFIIYNRFGEKVFETKNAAECWNGNYKGQPLDPGGYVYYLSGKTLCGEVIKKGSILLIR